MSTILPPNPLPTDDCGSDPVRLVLRPLLEMNEEQFFQLVVQNHREQCLEQDAQGAVILVVPHGALTSSKNVEITYQLSKWNKEREHGIVFSSRTLFRFANGAARSPDAAWVVKARWNRLTAEEQESIALLCPNFVIELRCYSDRLVDLQDKLVEYLDNGVELGWIIDPLLKQVHIYATGQPVQILDQPTSVGGTGCVEGFVLDLRARFLRRRGNSGYVGRSVFCSGKSSLHFADSYGHCDSCLDRSCCRVSIYSARAADCRLFHLWFCRARLRCI